MHASHKKTKAKTPRHIAVKLLKTKDKEKILKADLGAKDALKHTKEQR